MNKELEKKIETVISNNINFLETMLESLIQDILVKNMIIPNEVAIIKAKEMFFKG